MGNPSAQWNDVVLRIEQSIPMILVFSTVLVAIFAPLSISNSHIIHMPETKRILSGEDGILKLNNSHAQLRELNDSLTQIIRTKQPGPLGSDGSKGSRGQKGQKGDRGIKGEQGDRGVIGSQGPKGGSGPTGEKGERGPRGEKGTENGPKGERGPKGEKGEKGEGPFVPPGPREIDLGRNSKGDTKVYKVRCHKKCGSVSISLRTGRGDADLYGKEESPPIISDSNCNSCTLCKSRDSDLTDQCLVTTIRLDSFYLAVHAHKSYHDGVLKVDGPNFMTIELDRGDSVIHDDGDV